MQLQPIFKQLNLSEEHLQVYLANLEWGTTSITNIARKSKLPRTSIYLIFKELIRLGLIIPVLVQGKTNYQAAAPEAIEALLRQKQQELANSIFQLQTTMTELKSLQNSNPAKPKVLFLEGAEGIKQAYNRSLAAKEIWVQCLAQDYETVVPGDFFDKYFVELYESGKYNSREILPKLDEPYESKANPKRNLIRRIAVIERPETDILIFDDTVVYVSFDQERPYALVIEDREIAKSARIMYQLAWEQAKE